MAEHGPAHRVLVHRIRDWVLLIVGFWLLFNEIVIRMTTDKDASVPLITAALTCWGLVPALRHGDKQP